MQFTLHCFLKTARFSRPHFVNILARLTFDARLDARPTFEEHLKMILSNLKKLQDFCVRCGTNHLDQLYQVFTTHLFGSTLVMAILYMTKPTMHPFIKCVNL